MRDTFNDRCCVYRRVSDFSLNILLFVRQEIIGISSSSDIVLAHQTVQGSSHLLTHDDLIHADIISHQDNDIIQIRLNIIDVTNQVQKLQHGHILLLNAGIRVCRLLAALDHSADRTVKECVNCVVEEIERCQCIFVLILDLLCSFLESGQHGTLTAGQMLSGIAVLANLGEHLLHDDELIRYEREVPCKLSRTAVALDVQNGIREGEQISQHGIIFVVDLLQLRCNLFLLLKDTLLDNLIRRRRCQGQSGLESGLNT